MGRGTLITLCVTLSSIFYGCNIFQGMDSPSGDAQILAAAHSCLDQGDYACATRYYLQLSSSVGDTKYSELPVSTLAESGLPPGTLAQALIDSNFNIGKLITILAGKLSYQASSSLRLQLFHGYQQSLLIQNTQLQGALRLMTSLALLSEILGEDASTPGTYLATDLASNPTACLSVTSPAGAIALITGACNIPTGKKLISGNSITNLYSATEAAIQDLTFSGAPTLTMISATIAEMQTALSLLSSNSKFTTGLSSFFNTYYNQFASATINTGNNNSSPGFIYLLLKIGIGT
jgi:hypothetical protein